MRDFNEERRKRLQKNGTVILFDVLKTLEHGDKVMIKTEDETIVFDLSADNDIYLEE